MKGEKSVSLQRLAGPHVQERGGKQVSQDGFPEQGSSASVEIPGECNVVDEARSPPGSSCSRRANGMVSVGGALEERGR